MSHTQNHTDQENSTPTSPYDSGITFIGTFNILTLLKPEKVNELTKKLTDYGIQILALQETRFTDQEDIDSGNYIIRKGKPARILRNLKIFGTAFAVSKSLIKQSKNLDLKSPSERISILTLEVNERKYSFINAHAPTDEKNRTNRSEVEIFWQLLEECTRNIPKENIKILLGDFNAQIGREEKYLNIVGHYPAHSKTTKNGEHLIDFCRVFELKLTSTYFDKPAIEKYTWISRNPSVGQRQIDHVAISENCMDQILDVTVLKDVVDSDHYMTQIKLRLRLDTTNCCSNNDPEYVTENATGVLPGLSCQYDSSNTSTLNPGKPQRELDFTWSTSSEETKANRGDFWNPLSGHHIPERNRLLNAPNSTTKIFLRGKHSYSVEMSKEANPDFNKEGEVNFYNTFQNNLFSYQSSTVHLHRFKGGSEVAAKQICVAIANYFQTFLSSGPTRRRPRQPNPSQPQQDESQPITMDETRGIIRSLIKSESSEMEGFSEELQILGDRLIRKLQVELVEIWKNETIPNDLNRSLIRPVIETDKSFICTFLYPVTYSVLSEALLHRLELQTNRSIGEYQAGFRKGRSCEELIWSLKMILNIRQSCTTFVTFVAFEKSFDSVDRNRVYDILNDLEIDGKTRNLIRQCLTNTTSVVEFCGHTSEPFETHKGLRQGDALSPFIFNLVLDRVIKEWQIGIDGIRTGKFENMIKINCLAYSDNLAIITKSIRETKDAIEKLHTIASKVGLRISYEKTRYMVKQRGRNLSSPLKTTYGIIEPVNSFKYLGEVFDPSNSDAEANLERVYKFEKSYDRAWQYFGKRDVPRDQKLRHYQNVVLTEALYASETICLRGFSNISKIEKQERKVMNKIKESSAEDGVWNDNVTTDLGIQTEGFVNIVRRKRLKFYGHIFRMESNRIAKRLFNVIKQSKINIKWLKETEEDLKELNITEDTLRNRVAFEARVSNHKFNEENVQRCDGRWTEERRLRQSEIMKKYWEKKRASKLRTKPSQEG